MWSLFRRPSNCSHAAVKYFTGISHLYFWHGPSASIRAHLLQPYFPVLSAQWGFIALQAKWCRNHSPCGSTRYHQLAFLTEDIRHSRCSSLSALPSLSPTWSVTNTLGKCHLCHLVSIMLQLLVNIERPDFMGEVSSVVSKVCATVNILPWSGLEQDTCIHAVSCWV